MIGDWLNADTSIEEIAAFAEKVYVKKDLSGFTGDSQFIQSEECARECFQSYEVPSANFTRGAHRHTTDDGEKERMNDEADFAFRQAWALCPIRPKL